MNFYISRLIIWFEPEDKPQELNFLPNKVNVKKQYYRYHQLLFALRKVKHS